MKRFLFTTIAAAVLLSGCGTTKYLSGVDPGTVGDIALVGPLANIDQVSSEGLFEDRGMKNDALSGECEKIIAGVMPGTALPVVTRLPLLGADHPDELRMDIEALAFVDPKVLGEKTLPDQVRKYLLDNGFRYGLMVYSAGFRKDTGTYAKRTALIVAAAVVVAIASMGMVQIYPDPGEWQGCDLHMMLVDAQEDRILFFKRDLGPGNNPVSEKELQRRLSKMARKFK